MMCDYSVRSAAVFCLVYIAGSIDVWVRDYKEIVTDCAVKVSGYVAFTETWSALSQSPFLQEMVNVMWLGGGSG